MYHTSCEGKLAQLLTTGVTEIGGTQDLDIGGYKAVYTQVSGTSDRTATYSYAELKTDDYITVTGDGVNTLSVSEDTVNQAYFDDFNESKASYGEIGFEETSDSLLMTFKPKASADYTVYLMKEGESVYSQIAMTKSGGSYTCLLYTSPSPRDRG